MAFLTALLLICRLELRSLFRSVRTWVAAGIVLLVAAIAVLAGGAAPAERIFSGMSVMMLQIIAPLVGLVLGSVVISEEVEARTITFIFTRPVHRSALFIGRWLAVGLLAAGLLGGSAALTTWGTTHALVREPAQRTEWVREFQRGERWVEADRSTHRRVLYEVEGGDLEREWIGWIQPGEIYPLQRPDKLNRPNRIRGLAALPVDMTLPAGASTAFAGAAALAALFYTMITAGLSIFVKRPLIFGLGYAFAFEGLLANLPGSTQALSVQHHVRSMLISGSPPELFERFRLFGEMEFFTPGEAVLRLLAIGGGVLALCAWAVQRRQFVLTS
ncbi:MAG: ABC transporter permease [Planctomycetota bacterium]|nr:ABC transporter permease [Planctomycetota bacterium]